MSNRPTTSPAMLKALALVAGGMSQRKAAAAAGVSLSGLIMAMRRYRAETATPVDTMKVGARYRVTRGSRNGEFQVGDVVMRAGDGSIVNHAAGGWMDAGDVQAATDGWQIELDKEWLAKRRAKLVAELAEIDKAG